jgi:catechol 2,3-dioxygenase-like lactoylglutathione lyase family enzyme
VDFRHLALFVSDLRAAEEYYRDVFGMELIGRESWGDDGVSYSLPPDKGWDDAEVAGIELRVVALRRGRFILALFAGQVPAGQVYAVGLVMSEDGIDEVASRVAAGAVTAHSDRFLEFVDPFSVRWQISTDRDFVHAGTRGRWLDV